MKRLASVLAIGLLVMAAAPLGAANLPKDGTYELAIRNNSQAESIGYLIKLETKEKAVGGELIASAEAFGDVILKDVTLDGDTLRFTIKSEAGAQIFEGRVPAADASEILGSFGNDARVQAARFAISDKTSIGRNPQSVSKK